MDARPDAEPRAEPWLRAVYNADRCRCRVLISQMTNPMIKSSQSLCYLDRLPPLLPPLLPPFRLAVLRSLLLLFWLFQSASSTAILIISFYCFNLLFCLYCSTDYYCRYFNYSVLLLRPFHFNILTVLLLLF